MPYLQSPRIYIGYTNLSTKQEKVLQDIYRLIITTSKLIKTDIDDPRNGG